jgi:hypothetical protein
MFAVVGWCRLGRLAPPLRARMWAVWILGSALCVVSPATALGQTTGSATIWSFLGVPNPFGLNAADQQSANPAIQAAAKAKAAKHEICKKKKAIAYLAGLGCTPEHPEVGPALIAAMSDPDEPVRYEAVKAVLQTAGECQSADQKREAKKAQSHSDRCHDLKKKIDKAFCDCIDRLCGKAPPKEHKHKHKNTFAKLLGRDECEDPCKKDCDSAASLGSCCSPEMREKLSTLAYGRDDNGCFLERSQRVRDMAEQALKACNACSGCGECGPCSAGSAEYAVREMPPVDARELPPVDTDGDCVHDSVMVPLPTEQPHPETGPAPGPSQEPLALPLPAPEPIPLPPSVLVPSRPAARSAALPPPSGVRRFGGEPVPEIVATARPRHTIPSSVWNPADPLQIVDSAGGDHEPGFPPHPRPSRLQLARAMAGTAAVAERTATWPTLPAMSAPRAPAVAATGFLGGSATSSGLRIVAVAAFALAIAEVTRTAVRWGRRRQTS